MLSSDCRSAIRRAHSISCCRSCALRRERSVSFGPAVAEELPDFPYFGDHVEVEVGDHDFIFIAAGLRDDLTARIAEITLRRRIRRCSTAFPFPRD